jgi:cytidine deaminase
VGAALLTKSGRIYAAANVENAVYGLSICAERNAIFQAVANGDLEFEAIAVVTKRGVTPCGSCRQVLREFGDDELRILVADEAGSPRRVCTLAELLPEAFTREDLPPTS